MDTKYLRQIALYVLTTLVSVGVILYLGYHLFYGLTQKMETEPALLSSVTESVEADVYIFRQETPLSASGSGSLVPAVADGERVGVGDVVARQYDVSSPDIVAQIAGLDMQLSVIDQMRRQRISVRDTGAVDSEIYALLSEVAAAGASGECGGISSLRASLSAAMNRRALLVGSSADIEAAASRLQAEKNALTARLGTCRAERTTAVSGYYYASCDGYESLFTAEEAQTMTPARFDELTEAQASGGASAGKIVTGYEWYAACRLPAEKEADFTAGKTYEVRFLYNGGRTLKMTLERMERDEKGVLLVFSSAEIPGDFLFTRSQSVTIVTRDYSGLKLPLSALRVSDGITGVYILEGGVVHFRAVRILAEGEDYFLAEPEPDGELPEGCTWLSRNDIVITRGRGLTEGRVLA